MKQVIIRITDNTQRSELRDTTVGKLYAAVLASPGEVVDDVKMIQLSYAFFDDVGDLCDAFVAKPGIELVAFIDDLGV